MVHNQEWFQKRAGHNGTRVKLPNYIKTQMNLVFYCQRGQKFVNLQYNTLVCWADGTNYLSIKRLMFQLFFFIPKILQNSLQKPFQFIFSFFYKITKMKIKSFECLKSKPATHFFQTIKISFGPSDSCPLRRSTKGPSVLY